MPLDFPIDAFDQIPATSVRSPMPGREDLAIKAIMAWLETQPQGLWMHYLRSRNFGPGTIDREVGIRLATHPALDCANARLLFWKLFRHYPYFGSGLDQKNPVSGLPALEMSLRNLADRIDCARLDPSRLELSAGELRGFLTPFEISRTRARARGWRRRNAPFAIPKALFLPYRGQPAPVPDTFPGPSDPAQAALVMADARFGMSHIIASHQAAIALKRHGQRWSALIWAALGVACGTVAITMHTTGII